jgi:large subunit ribosomal protein L29
MAKVGELRDLGDEDLIERLESSKEELFNLRFQLATGQLDNPMRIKDVRHDVARILTILREREIASLAETEAELESERRAQLEARRAAPAADSATEADAENGDEPVEAPAAMEEPGTKRRRLRRSKPAEGQEDQ